VDDPTAEGMDQSLPPVVSASHNRLSRGCPVKCIIAFGTGAAKSIENDLIGSSLTPRADASFPDRAQQVGGVRF